jgi:putative ABC transport system permease protein
VTLLLVRLAFAGIRSRLLASALTIAIAAAAVATIVLVLEVRTSGVEPWRQTFAEANGAHVLALVATRADAAAIGQLPGVAERGVPVPQVRATAGPPGDSDQVQLAGLSDRTAVNRPVPTAGGRLRDGGIVLERSLAGALGVPVGGTFQITTRRGTVELPVLGTAVVPSQARYPRSQPGLAWVTRPTLEQLEPDQARWSWSQAVRLADPSTAAAFSARAAAGLSAASRTRGAYLQTWQAQQDNALGDAQGTQVIVTMFTVLLLVDAFVVIGILAAARAGEQHRQIGLLKAAGFTPRQVGMVFALESAALGVVAAMLGFGLGAILAPRLAAPSAETLVGSPTTAADPWHMLVAACVVVPVLLAAALSATRRSTRFTVVEAIGAGTPSPPKPHWLGAVAPLTVGLGLMDLLARQRRALLLAAAIALTGATVVVVLSLDATLDVQRASETSDFPDELLVLIYALDAVLLLVSLTTLVAVALLSVRERIRDYGVLRTIGLTPGQVASTIVGAHAALALVASLVAVPLGIALYLGLYRIASGTIDDAVIAPWWSLALIPVGTVLAVVVATSLPARVAARLRPTDALRYE